MCVWEDKQNYTGEIGIGRCGFDKMMGWWNFGTSGHRYPQRAPMTGNRVRGETLLLVSYGHFLSNWIVNSPSLLLLLLFFVCELQMR